MEELADQILEEAKAPEVDIQASTQELAKVAGMRQKVFTQLIQTYKDVFYAVMMNSRSPELKKRQARTALNEVDAFILDFGLNNTGATLRDKGTFMAKETNSLAGIMCQALDNRMLQLAQKMNEQAEASNKAMNEVVAETQALDLYPELKTENE